MSVVLTIAYHELKTMYRRRMFQIVTVALPVVALGALAVAWLVHNTDQDEEADKVGYVDAAGLFTGHQAQGQVDFVSYPTRDAGMAALLADDVRRLYLIPEDYLGTGLVERFKVGLGLGFDEGADPQLRGFLLDNLSEAAPESEVIERLKDPLRLAGVAVDSTGAVQQLNFPRVLFFLVLAFLLMFSLAMTGGFLLQGLGEEKENRIMEVLLSSVTPAQFMIGKVLGLGAAGLSQILAWVVSGRIILELLSSVASGVELSLPGLGPTLVAFVFFVLGYLLFATLMAGVGAISPTTRESQQLSIILTLPLIVPIYGWIYIVENPTAVVVRIGTFFPLTAPLIVLQRLGPEAIEPWELAASLVVLGLSVVGAMLLAGRVFRAFLLSYGKRPGLRVLWSSMRRG